MFLKKRFVIWPLVATMPIGYWYFSNRFFTRHNKKLFDMCNVGEEFYLGAQRNEVLRQCNKIQDREDF